MVLVVWLCSVWVMLAVHSLPGWLLMPLHDCNSSGWVPAGWHEAARFMVVSMVIASVMWDMCVLMVVQQQWRRGPVKRHQG